MKVILCCIDDPIPLTELYLTDITFDFKNQQFLLEAGYSRTPILTDVHPTEINIAHSEVRLRFRSADQAREFIGRLREALTEATRRSERMLD